MIVVTNYNKAGALGYVLKENLFDDLKLLITNLKH